MTLIWESNFLINFLTLFTESLFNKFFTVPLPHEDDFISNLINILNNIDADNLYKYNNPIVAVTNHFIGYSAKEKL